MTVAKYQQPTQDGSPSESAPVIYKNKLDILHEANGMSQPLSGPKVPIKLLSFNFFFSSRYGHLKKVLEIYER